MMTQGPQGGRACRRESCESAFSPNGRLVASAGFDNSGGPGLKGVGRVWDVRSGKARSFRMKMSGNSLSLSPDRRYLAGDGVEVKIGGNAEVYDVRPASA
jgi:WD40 repeat protein